MQYCRTDFSESVLVIFMLKRQFFLFAIGLSLSLSQVPGRSRQVDHHDDGWISALPDDPPSQAAQPC